MGTGNIQDHITHGIATVYARDALIADIGDCQHTSVGKVGGIKKFKVGFGDVDGLLHATSVDIHFMYLPAAGRIQRGK